MKTKTLKKGSLSELFAFAHSKTCLGTSNSTSNSSNSSSNSSCDGTSNSTTYIGQTTNLRNRMNNHISECRTGKSSCNFPKHVFECAKANNSLKEPFFKVFVFMALTDAKLLLHYESKLFKAGHATLNS